MALVALSLGAIGTITYVANINEPYLSSKALEYEKAYKESRGIT